MKIIYTIAGFYRPAGMERVLAGKVNALSARGWDVLVVTTEQQGRRKAFAVDERVRFCDLGIGYEKSNGKSFIVKALSHPLKQFRHRCALSSLLKKEKADIVVSMFCGDERFITGIHDSSRKVLEVHFSRFKRLQYGRRGLWAVADRLRSLRDARVARRFGRFVVLTKEDLGYWGQMPGIRCIPNARTFTMPSTSALDNHIVLAAGRYSAQKSFDRLLRAWSLVNRGDWKLRIAGDGEQRLSLEALAAELGIQDSVVFGPAEGDIRELYANASIFALSSLYEGLPMVLLEAQAAGLPIVSFCCKCGPRDIISDGVDGYLVEEGDIQGLANRLEQLMQDDALRRRMGAAAYSASGRYDEQIVMSQWDSLFRELL